MSYDYKPDRWRDRSIVSQTAGKIAADLTLELLRLYPPADGALAQEAVVGIYAPLHAEVLSTIISGAGEDEMPIPDPSQGDLGNGSGGSDRERSGTSSSTSGEPYGSTVLKFGKYKGMTISEINNAVDDQGKSGRSYLEWLNGKTDDQFMRKATGAFLEATR